MTSLPFSIVPGNRSYRYIACSVKLVMRGSLLQLHKVRDILNDAPLQQLIITPTTETPTIQLTDDNDSDTTIIYDISNNSETRQSTYSTDSQPLNTLSPVPFDNNVIHLQTDDNKTFVQCEDYDSDETYLSNTEQLPLNFQTNRNVVLTEHKYVHHHYK